MSALRLDAAAEEIVRFRVQRCRERRGTCLHRPAEFVRAVRHWQGALALNRCSGIVGPMNRSTAIDVPRLSVPLVLGWLCALSPYIVLFVVGTAWLHQQPVWRNAFGPFANHYRAVMLPVLNVGWSLSMMFAVYAAGPLWLLLVCRRRWRRSWQVHAMQVITCGAGWILIWLLIIQTDLLTRLG